MLGVLVLIPAMPVHASAGEGIPPLAQFTSDLVNGNPDELRGIYVPGIMAYPILPQPEDSPEFVTPERNALTLFDLPSHYDTTGLLAHNYLAGADFFLLEGGQLIYLIYGDGRTGTYIVRGALRYQAVIPDSVMSSFVDLETGELLSASRLFMKVYNRPGQLVLQTCMYEEGDPSWGRLFVIAEPYRVLEPRSMPEDLSLQ